MQVVYFISDNRAIRTMRLSVSRTVAIKNQLQPLSVMSWSVRHGS